MQVCCWFDVRVGIGRAKQDSGVNLWNIMALPNVHGWQVFNFRQAIFSIRQASVILTEKKCVYNINIRLFIRVNPMRVWTRQSAICSVYHCQSLCRCQDLRNDSKAWSLLSAAPPHVFTCGLQVCACEDISTRPGISHTCCWECSGLPWVWCTCTRPPAETHQAQWGTTFVLWACILGVGEGTSAYHPRLGIWQQSHFVKKWVQRLGRMSENCTLTLKAWVVLSANMQWRAVAG